MGPIQRFDWSMGPIQRFDWSMGPIQLFDWSMGPIQLFDWSMGPIQRQRDQHPRRSSSPNTYVVIFLSKNLLQSQD